MKSTCFSCVAILALATTLQQQTSATETPLWAEAAPGALGTEPIDRPTLTVHRPKGNQLERTAVVICPGGGYQHLALDHEGQQIADWLNSLGVTACVLKYRLAPKYHHPAPLLDAQRAIRTVRANAKEWNLDPAKIGVIGFSAGGHLASTTATHFDAGDKASKDSIDTHSSRPDFALLVYPVIAMATEYAHAGSRKNLLGDSPDPKLLESMSNERQVTKETPPCFLVASSEDKPVPPENSVLFYLACQKQGVPAELHVYEHGPHGFGLGNKGVAPATWPGLCVDWLRRHKFLGDGQP